MNKFLTERSRYFLLIGILFVCTITKAQYREMVFNGGFEFGNTANIPYGGFGHNDDWINTIGDWIPAAGTFDWWDWDTYISRPLVYTLSTGANVTPPPRATGTDRFIGLIGYTDGTGKDFCNNVNNCKGINLY